MTTYCTTLLPLPHQYPLSPSPSSDPFPSNHHPPSFPSLTSTLFPLPQAAPPPSLPTTIHPPSPPSPVPSFPFPKQRRPLPFQPPSTLLSSPPHMYLSPLPASIPPGGRSRHYITG
ncbi:hypothetical protein Pcinc_043408 [Petrolisthes cinctipes]|uniref:Uncharacterized protein n=1 Tax=Petrolisthes cinctipes TaxID=88211 RepID=A0AAE1EHW7_PETCI|nr:hypothetical protein Pcinc_043408 [Petrolisthes cinctipes]